jgi:predicted amidohydrolase YtcJ
MMWLNSKALSLAGIGPSTETSPGGVIGRDAHGAPNGLLFENAMGLVESAIPPITHATAVNLIKRHLPALHRVGLTGVHVPEGSRSFRALQSLDAASELALRVHMMLPSGVAQDMIAAGVTTGLGSPRLKVGHVKFFVDGSLGSETAAMFEPFIGSSGNVGILTMDPVDLLEQVRTCIGADLAPAVHAIGDRANRVVLDVFEATRDAWHPKGMRPRIEHVQVLHPADVERFGSLGIVASAQPIHATQDMELVDRLWGSRGRYAYAFGSLQATGATLAFGSDAPVETPDPLRGIYAAVTRRRRDGNPDGGWYPEERLTVAGAIAAYTIGAAWASKDEGVVGELSPGARADMVVLSGDPFDMSHGEAEALARLRVCATVFEGEVVYRE